MFGLGGESADCLFDCGHTDGSDLGARLTCQALGKCRACRNGGRAAEHLVADFHDPVLLEPRREPQDIAARRV